LSFVEKNKTWLLPLLGVGVAAVAYLNFRKPARPRPAPAVQAKAAPAPPAAPPPAPGLVMAPPAAMAPAAPASAPMMAAAAPGTGADLWGDLKPLAVPPGSSLQESALRERCRESLDPLLDPGFPAGLPHPGPVREAAAAPAPAPVRIAAAGPAPVKPARPLPQLEFILTGDGPPRAWLEGRLYREGQSLPGGAFRVGAIGWNQVALIDPAGKTTFLTTDSHRPAAGSRPTVEVP